MANIRAKPFEQQLRDRFLLLWNHVALGKAYLLNWKELNNYLAANKDIEGIAQTFFNLTRGAYLEAGLLRLSKLYDKRGDVANLKDFLAFSKKYVSRAIDPKKAKMLIDAWISEQSLLSAKLLKFERHRNKQLIHMDKETWLIKGGPSPEGFSLEMALELFDKAADFIIELYEAFTGEKLNIEIPQRTDFKDLFQYARKGRWQEVWRKGQDDEE